MSDAGIVIECISRRWQNKTKSMKNISFYSFDFNVEFLEVTYIECVSWGVSRFLCSQPKTDECNRLEENRLNKGKKVSVPLSKDASKYIEMDSKHA